MEQVLKRLASALVAGAVESARAALLARLDQELDHYLDVAAAKITADDHLPEFITRALAAELRSADTRAKLHALVSDEVDQLIAGLQAKLS